MILILVSIGSFWSILKGTKVKSFGNSYLELLSSRRHVDSARQKIIIQITRRLTWDCKKLAFLKARALSFSGLKLASRAEPMSPIIGMLAAVQMIHQSDSFITIQWSVKWKLGVHINSLDCTCSKKAFLYGKMGSPRLVQGSWGSFGQEPARALARLVQTLRLSQTVSVDVASASQA